MSFEYSGGKLVSHREIVRPEIKAGKDPSLLEVVEYLNKQEFDPNKVGYEFTVSVDEPITYEALQMWSGVTRYESLLALVVVSDGERRLRFSTGLTDQTLGGKFIADLKYDSPNRRYLFCAHNHSIIGDQISDPYPSVADLRGADCSEANLIVSTVGLTIFGTPINPLADLPDELKERFGQVPIKVILGDLQKWAAIMNYLQEHSTEYANCEQGMKASVGKRLLLGALQARYTIIPWESKEEIEKLLSEVQNGRSPLKPPEAPKMLQ